MEGYLLSVVFFWNLQPDFLSLESIDTIRGELYCGPLSKVLEKVTTKLDLMLTFHLFLPITSSTTIA